MKNQITKSEQLLSKLLECSSKSFDVFNNAIEAIHSIMECRYIALWSIDQESDVMSLIANSDNKTELTRNDNDTNYVHRFQGSFTEHVIGELGVGRYKNFDDINDCGFIEKHRSLPLIRSRDCKRCYFMVLDNKIRNSNSIEEKSILYIYPGNEDHFTEFTLENINNFFSLAIANYHVLRKEHLTSSIIDLHNSKKGKDINSLLYPIINKILKTFISYQAGSIFLYDSLLNRLELAATTGIKGFYKKSQVCYNLGEGLTGMVGESLEPMILHAHQTDFTQHDAKFSEEKDNKTQSLLIIPITSVTDRSLLGVIRFVNRVNPVSGALDYFNKQDVNDLSHVSYLLSLYMEFDKIDNVVDGFSKQLAHETITPAVGIKGAAYRLVQFLSNDDKASLDKYLKSYCDSIFEFSTLQIAQTQNILYAWQRRKNLSKNDIYNDLEEVNLKEVIQSCKKLVFPIIRDERLTFDHIEISNDYPTLYIDRNAFEPVFLNLLRNTIKYRKRNGRAMFKVEITCSFRSNFIGYEKEALGNGYVIDFLDYGIGIDQNEVDKIFYMGYRGKQIEKTEVRGLGIGLTVCIRVLKDFYCRIWVHSNREPTIFRIFIPEFLIHKDYTKRDDWLSNK